MNRSLIREVGDLVAARRSGRDYRGGWLLRSHLRQKFSFSNPA